MKNQKFSKHEIKAKERIKRERISKRMTMKQASAAIGLSVKKLEDVETPKLYGCHITLDILVKVSNGLGVTIASLAGES